VISLSTRRIVGRKPKNLSWEQAAAEPLTVLTAWEGMVERMAIPVPPAGTVYKNPKTLLVIAGAGGVGTCAIQLGKHVLGLRVVATANREETIKFCKELGADFTIKHGEPLQPQLKALGIDGVDYVMHCWEAHTLWDELPAIINPLGKLSFLTTGEELKVKPFMSKGIAICPELMFTRPIYGFDLEAQRTILDAAANLLESKIWKPRMTQAFEWTQLLEAHKLVESGKAIGKVSVRLP
jgi:NADPH:quinone reductase